MTQMPFQDSVLSLALVLGLADTVAADGTVTPINAIPFQISNSGRYCLTQSVDGVAGMNGITIVASNVELDLNGFSIRGKIDSGSGVVAAQNANVRIKNGSIFGWPDTAIDATGIQVSVENVYISSVAYGGLQGVVLGPGSRIERCTVSDMTVVGVALGDGSSARDVRVEMDGASGVGIALGAGAKAIQCSVKYGNIGIQGSVRAFVDCCDVSQFTMTGIETGEYAIVHGCRIDGTPMPSAACVATPTGIAIGVLSRASDCTVVAVPGNGVTLAEGATASKLSVADSSTDGFQAIGPRTVVEHCMATLNGGNGITTGEEGVVRYCTSSSNTGFGLLAQGPRGRLEGNTADSNQSGIVLQGLHNLATGNRAANNTLADFVIAPKSVTGPTIVTSGFLNLSNPFANFQTPLF